MRTPYLRLVTTFARGTLEGPPGAGASAPLFAFSTLRRERLSDTDLLGGYPFPLP